MSPSRTIMRGVTLMADGYEILRPVRGSSPGLGTDALMGKPMTGDRTHTPFRLTREVFHAYREQGWIAKARPYQSKGWQCWRITETGRQEARQRPDPSRGEVRAARAAARSAHAASPTVGRPRSSRRGGKSSRRQRAKA